MSLFPLNPKEKDYKRLTNEHFSSKGSPNLEHQTISNQKSFYTQIFQTKFLEMSGSFMLLTLRVFRNFRNTRLWIYNIYSSPQPWCGKRSSQQKKICKQFCRKWNDAVTLWLRKIKDALVLHFIDSFKRKENQENEKYILFFYKHCFLGQPQYPYDLYNLIPISGLQYAKKIELIVTIITQFQTQRCQLSVYQSTNPETAIQLCSVKYNCTLKSHCT